MSLPGIFVLAGLAVSAVVFAVSAYGKFQHPRKFRDALAAYQLIPGALVSFVAWAIAVSEAAIAALLVAVVVLSAADFLRLYAASGALVLYALFSGAVAINLLRGRDDIDCGCFFANGDALDSRQEPVAKINAGLLARNTALAAALLPAILTAIAGVALNAVWWERIGATLGAITVILIFASVQMLRGFQRTPGGSGSVSRLALHAEDRTS